MLTALACAAHAKGGTTVRVPLQQIREIYGLRSPSKVLETLERYGLISIMEGDGKYGYYTIRFNYPPHLQG